MKTETDTWESFGRLQACETLVYRSDEIIFLTVPHCRSSVLLLAQEQSSTLLNSLHQATIRLPFSVESALPLTRSLESADHAIWYTACTWPLRDVMNLQVHENPNTADAWKLLCMKHLGGCRHKLSHHHHQKDKKKLNCVTLAWERTIPT
jgi:hypothetical protein